LSNTSKGPIVSGILKIEKESGAVLLATGSSIRGTPSLEGPRAENLGTKNFTASKDYVLTPQVYFVSFRAYELGL
jgi:hypothetical protein